MASHIMVAVLWHLTVVAASFPDVASLPSQMDKDIAAAEAELHNEVLQDRLSFQAIGMPPLASNFAPQLFEVQSGNSLTAEAQLQLATRQLQQALAREHFRQQEVSTFSTQLDLAAQRLASQQRLASAQLEQAGVAANRALDNLGAASGSVPMPFVALQQQASVGIDRPSANRAKEPLALPQTITQLWRQKNPALAALLLEPALYGYSIIVWVILMLLTGISSAFCLLGNKLPFEHEVHQQLPFDAEAGRPQFHESAQNGGYNGLKSGSYGLQRVPTGSNGLFQYPGSYGSVHHAAPSLQQLYEAEEEEEGVESWIRVRVDHAPHSQPNNHSYGYVDDP